MKKTPENKRQFFDGFNFTRNNGRYIHFRHSPLRKSSISIFNGFCASIDKIFILERRLGTRL